MADDMTGLRLAALSREYEVGRFNPVHAPPGSAAGGQFAAAAGSGAQGKPPAKGPKPEQKKLLAEAHRDREMAGRLAIELVGLEKEQRIAAAAAAKSAAAAGGGAGGGKTARATSAAAHRKAAAQHRNHALHHKRNHPAKAAHHAKAVVHHTKAAGLAARIAMIRQRIHALIAAATAAEHKAAKL